MVGVHLPLQADAAFRLDLARMEVSWSCFGLTTTVGALGVHSWDLENIWSQRVPENFEFLPVSRLSLIDNRYTKLFEASFGPLAKFNQDALNWLYFGNPDGDVVGFDAWNGGELVAHYACVPARVELAGASVSVLLSLNTATHPAWQGKGLFTQLAERTYLAGAELGYSAVYGVANANSTPGFVRKLGFQHVRSLDARLGIGPLGVDLDVAWKEAQFRRVWSPEALLWRCSNPVNPVRRSLRGGVFGLQAAAIPGLVKVHAELPNLLEGSQQPDATGRWPGMRLSLGLTPNGGGRSMRWFDIPDRFRPSPLNLIYRPLNASLAMLDPAHIFFTFMDFDAY
jgi:GNAT superfamily N-acetyltransferase